MFFYMALGTRGGPASGSPVSILIIKNPRHGNLWRDNRQVINGILRRV
jgi:hypothetical protein